MKTLKNIFYILCLPYIFWRKIFDSKLIKFIDNIITRLFFYFVHIGHLSNLHFRYILEDYIIKKNYSLIHQFERYYNDEALELMAVTMLGHNQDWTNTSIYEHFFDLSNKSIRLSKRQCYNLKNIHAKIKIIVEKEEKEKRRAKRNSGGGSVMFH